MAINPTTLKALIDTQITNETVNFAITPLEVGGRMKDTVDYTTEQIANISLLQGSQYILVTANGTDIENAAELQAAYDTAKTMSPSVTNRITVIAAPGNYNFGSTTFTMDTQYIDLVSLDGNRSIVFNSANSAGTISITANDVFVKGVDVGTKTFLIGNNLNLLKVENCKGGISSFGHNVITSGEFTNCIGGDVSFGSQSVASGIFTNCVGESAAFAGDGTASGSFINCKGGNYAFGGAFGAIASGIFTNCIGGDAAFGGYLGTSSGSFTNCTSNLYAFGGAGGTASGIFTNCVGGNSTFGGGFGTASGIFTNCVGGASSFGNGGLTGKLYYCRLTSGTFITVSGAGHTRLCLDGINAANNQG